MASFVGTNIVEDGLIFHYDMANTQKSWKGKPATNLFSDSNLSNWSGSGTVEISNYLTPNSHESYLMTDSSSQYAVRTTNIAVPNNSSSYTMSLMIKKTFGGSSARLGINLGFNGGATALPTTIRFNSDTGVSTGGNVIDFGDWWYWYYTITNNSSGNTNIYYSFYPATGVHNGSDDPTALGFAIVGEFMMVSGSSPARYANGTRSNTQAVLDLAGNNTVTANSLTYNTDGTFQFNTTEALDIGPSSNYFPTGDIAHNLTVEMVVYPTTSLKMLFGQFIDLNRLYIGIYSDNTIRFGFGSLPWSGTYSGGSLRTVSLNKYCHACLSIINGAARLYVNGLESVYFTDTGVTLPSKLNFGVYYENGALAPSYLAACKIPLAKLYNRGLSSQEVKSNFEAVRSLYGI